MAIWPVILANKRLKKMGIPQDVLLHEQIHHKQQLELLLLFFYVWYLLEWLYKWYVYRDARKAYREISFEKEAYAHDKDPEYLHKRDLWGFWKYL